MKPRLFASALLLCLPLLAPAKEQVPLADDNASNSAYNGGWGEGSNGGNGFGPWTIRSVSDNSKGESHAGAFIADTDANADLVNVGIKKKAFGLFANGVVYEQSVAFRAFSKPLAVGMSFSFLFLHSEIVKKFDHDDPAPGSSGVTLRTGNANGSAGDYNKGARFEFGVYEGQGNYQIYDGEKKQDTGIPTSEGGLSVTFTLVSADTYDLEVTKLDGKRTTTLKGRKLGGAAGGALESFCIFNRDGEKNDIFFNGFQVSKDAN
ncbi:MAG: hypothetical protein JSR82_19915 [Verrucomicrobia bacterium]|nr:hypothetical protein [Verrucomicrobiota bacterium]